MINPIYTPKGRAGEYADLALNIYTGCSHLCTYCFAKKLHDRWKPNEDFADVRVREGIVDATKKQLLKGNHKGKSILLCFSCDPYSANTDTTPTREVIKAIKEAGAHVQILTKGGDRARRDFDLLDSGDSFGVTISSFNNKFEPKAAPWRERIGTLEYAHRIGIKTWVSCEPVLDAVDIYQLIELPNYIDLYKIGKLNYMPSVIKWGEFGRECERLCKEYGRNYYIKEDLRAEMEDTQ